MKWANSMLTASFAQSLAFLPFPLSSTTLSREKVSTSSQLPDSAAFDRSKQVLEVLAEDILRPFLVSTIAHGIPSSWEHFWTVETFNRTNAQHLVHALERLGPTYVKFGQALSTRQDIVPQPLADALEKLQDDMAPFDNDEARDILREELGQTLSREQLTAFLSSLSEKPVAAASIGQVYKGYLPDRGDVAVKIQRPYLRSVVEQDTAMLRQIAIWVEAIPGIPASNQDSLIATKLVDAVDEFMARVREELDYQNEAGNMEKFAELYCYRNGTYPDVKVVVPIIHKELCTDSVLVMEWIEGEKLASVGDPTMLDEATRLENLAMVEAGIAATLSQLLGTGLMHADPHTGNLLKVQTDQGLLLGFLDFGMLSTVPENVRDALVCAVAQLVFARDTQAVADLFGELDLIPASVVNDPTERLALAQALDAVFRDILLYPDETAEGTTLVPILRFDKLLAGLSLLVARFQFTLPPYFLNNARALGTLEGLARKLDPSFNSLQALYPYALNRILRNPSTSPIVEHTLLSLIRNRVSGKFDRDRLRKLLADTCLLSGRSRTQVIADVLSSKSGRRIARAAAKDSIFNGMHENQRRKRILFQL